MKDELKTFYVIKWIFASESISCRVVFKKLFLKTPFSNGLEGCFQINPYFHKFFLEQSITWIKFFINYSIILLLFIKNFFKEFLYF